MGGLRREWHKLTFEYLLTVGSPSEIIVNIGTIQRILAWPLRQDDTHTSRSVNKVTYLVTVQLPVVRCTVEYAALRARGAQGGRIRFVHVHIHIHIARYT